MVRDSFLTGLGTGTFNNSHVIFFCVCVCVPIFLFLGLFGAQNL